MGWERGGGGEEEEEEEEGWKCWKNQGRGVCEVVVWGWKGGKVVTQGRW